MNNKTTYLVTFQEILKKQIEIKASSSEEAKDIAERMYKVCDIVLEYNDFDECRISVSPDDTIDTEVPKEKSKIPTLGSVVWVKTGAPAYEDNGSHLARVVVINPYDDSITLENLDNGEMEHVFPECLTEVCSFPIDEKNLSADFIPEELLDSSCYSDNQYLGFIHEHPVLCQIKKDGSLLVTNPTNHPHVLPLVRERINDIFDCNPNASVVTSKRIKDNTMKIKFYSFYN